MTSNYAGAFGVVYHAILTADDSQPQEVAVKLVKGNLCKGLVRSLLSVPYTAYTVSFIVLTVTNFNVHY